MPFLIPPVGKIHCYREYTLNRSIETKINQLPNGLKVVVVSYPNIKTVIVHGISHCLEHMMFRGNKILAKFDFNQEEAKFCLSRMPFENHNYLA